MINYIVFVVGALLFKQFPSSGSYEVSSDVLSSFYVFDKSEKQFFSFLERKPFAFYVSASRVVYRNSDDDVRLLRISPPSIQNGFSSMATVFQRNTENVYFSSVLLHEHYERHCQIIISDNPYKNNPTFNSIVLSSVWNDAQCEKKYQLVFYNLPPALGEFKTLPVLDYVVVPPEVGKDGTLPVRRHFPSTLGYTGCNIDRNNLNFSSEIKTESIFYLNNSTCLVIQSFFHEGVKISTLYGIGTVGVLFQIPILTSNIKVYKTSTGNIEAILVNQDNVSLPFFSFSEI